MKRIICILMSVFIIASLCSCGYTMGKEKAAKDQNAGKGKSAATSTVTEDPKPAEDPVGSEPVVLEESEPMSPKVSEGTPNNLLGGITDDVYTNEKLGVRMNVPTWPAKSQEEILETVRVGLATLEQNGIEVSTTLDPSDKDNLNTFLNSGGSLVLFEVTDDTKGSIILMIQHTDPLIASGVTTPKDYLYDVVGALGQVNSYAGQNVDYLFQDITTVGINGRDFETLNADLMLEGQTDPATLQTYYCTYKDNIAYVLVKTSTSTEVHASLDEYVTSLTIS